MPEHSRYRRAVAADIPGIIAIERAAGFSQWSDAQLADSLANHHVLVVDAGGKDAGENDADGNDTAGKVAGFAVFSIVLDEAELLNIAINPDCQGQGLGRGLLMHGLGLLQGLGVEKCFLEVGINNGQAIALYEQCGFNRIAVRKGYYRHVLASLNKITTEDAIVMQLMLKEITCKN